MSVLFQHLEKGLIGVAQPPKAKDGSITVRLQPGAAVTGRLVDADGRPRPASSLNCRSARRGGRRSGQAGLTIPPSRIKTDPEGRFRIEALLPGYEFRLSDGKGELPFGDALRSGQTKDLGDVQLGDVKLNEPE